MLLFEKTKIMFSRDANYWWHLSHKLFIASLQRQRQPAAQNCFKCGNCWKNLKIFDSWVLGAPGMIPLQIKNRGELMSKEKRIMRSHMGFSVPIFAVVHWYLTHYFDFSHWAESPSTTVEKKWIAGKILKSFHFYFLKVKITELLKSFVAL